jgi:cytochrome c553
MKFLVVAASLGIGLAGSAEFPAELAAVLRERCLGCHNAKSVQGGLDLSTPTAALKGGKSGRAIEPGASGRSLLIEKVVSGSMPPGGPKLAEGDIAKMRAWIDAAAGEQAGAVTERDALSIFQMRCVVCHGKRLQQGGLDLRTHAARLRGGKSGPALIPGKPDESLIMKRILSGDMPPAKLQFDFSVRPPSNAEVETLRRWIAGGAPQSEATVGGDSTIAARDREFWSFQPVSRQTPPRVKNQERVRTAVDAFLLEKLEAAKLSFAPPAAPAVLARRAWMAVTGMPPSVAELDAFLSDKRPDAYARLVDKLLQSPAYGERWGRYWLDAVGYSDSEGKVDADEIRPQAWRYRDYVIHSLNADKPYDQFLREQIAGDEMVAWQGRKHVSAEELEKLVATGFWRMAADGTYSPPQSFLPERMNVIADQIEVFSSAVLGLTVGCARCHNHKYDPLPQRDYYRLAAVLQTAYDPYDWVIPTKRHLNVSVEEEYRAAEAANAPIEAEIRRVEALQQEREKPLREKLLEERLNALPEAVRGDLRLVAATEAKARNAMQSYLAEKFADTLRVATAQLTARFAEYRNEAENYRKQLAELRGRLKPLPHVRALYEMGGEPSGAYLLRRGDALSPGEEVSPGVPAVLAASLPAYRPGPAAGESSGRRLGLAEWVTHPEHPLTARVIVNRIWMHYFGRGIVSSPGNFGRTGAAPSHPKLLDWLAGELTRKGWRLKEIHRAILLSSAFQQSSQVTADREAADPENVLLSRMPLRRLDADALHDSILFVTGQLDQTPFGAPSPIEVKPDGEVVAKPGANGYRRAIYLLQRRRSPVTMLETFDTPPMSPNCIERPRSVVATQALQLLNSAATLEHARHLAGRILDSEPGNRIEAAWRRVLGRPATVAEATSAATALRDFEQQWKAEMAGKREASPQAWKAQWYALGDLIHTLLNSAEFSYVD